MKMAKPWSQAVPDEAARTLSRSMALYPLRKDIECRLLDYETLGGGSQVCSSLDVPADELINV